MRADRQEGRSRRPDEEQAATFPLATPLEQGSGNTWSSRPSRRSMRVSIDGQPAGYFKSAASATRPSRRSS